MIIVDHNHQDLERLREAVHFAAPQCKPACFHHPEAALVYAQTHPLDVAFLEIQLAYNNGLLLAADLKRLHPCINIIFVTAQSQYGHAAFEMHASGYILKPFQKEDVQDKLAHLRFPIQTVERARLQVQCFGLFSVRANGRELIFTRKKSKELFAYLISRRGAVCTNGEIAAVLWEQRPDSRSLQSNLRNLVSDLMGVLRDCRAEDIIQKGRGTIAVLLDRIDCDYFNFCQRDPSALARYSGEFMIQYPWAQPMTHYLNQHLR